MPATHDTAYPRLKSSWTENELNTIFIPTAGEIELAHSLSPNTSLRIAFLVLLKTFSRVGYFLPLHKVPRQIAEHLSLMYGVHYDAMEWEAYDASGSRYRHVARIREHLGVKSFDGTARSALSSALRQAAQLREDVVDIINIAVEELIRLRYELPAFSTLRDEAQRVRAAVNREFFERVFQALGEDRCRLIDHLLEVDGVGRRSLWHSLKFDPGAPSLKQMRAWVERLKWVKSLDLHSDNFFAGIPAVRVQRYVLEARSLNAARMLELEPHKRYTLAAALVRQQVAQCLDDLGEMLIKKMRRAHRQAHDEYQQALLRRQTQTDQLVMTFHRLLLIWRDELSGEDKLTALGAILDHQGGALLEQCQTHAALANHNYLGFLWRHFQAHRSAVFTIIEEIVLTAPGNDKSLEWAISFLKAHRQSRQDWVAASFAETNLDLNWVPDRWWKPVTGREKRSVGAVEVQRRYFEMCVFTRLAEDLQSGDLVIGGSGKYSDYRDQFVSDEEFRVTAEQYCEQAGLPARGDRFVDRLREQFDETAVRVNDGFPANESLRIEGGEPVLQKLRRQKEPENLPLIAQLVREHLPPVSLLDVLADTESWLNWTRHFGPLSGHEAKLGDPIGRYLHSFYIRLQPRAKPGGAGDEGDGPLSDRLGQSAARLRGFPG